MMKRQSSYKRTVVVALMVALLAVAMSDGRADAQADAACGGDWTLTRLEDYGLDSTTIRLGSNIRFGSDNVVSNSRYEPLTC
jgi:hypothetical protein